MNQTTDTDVRATLRRMREVTEAATPGEWTARCRDISGKLDSSDWSGLGWEVDGPPEPMLRGQFGRGEDAQFVAMAHTALPLLLDALEAAYAALEYTGESTDNVPGLGNIYDVADGTLATITEALEGAGE